MQSTKGENANDRDLIQRPLAGARCWLITDGKAGMDVQARGVADALGVSYERKLVEPTGIYKIMAPWGPVASRERFGEVHAGARTNARSHRQCQQQHAGAVENGEADRQQQTVTEYHGGPSSEPTS